MLRDPREVVRLAHVQAAITHDTPGGRDSSAAVALMAHYALHEAAPLSEVHAFLARSLPVTAPFAQPWDGPVGTPDNDALGLGIGLCTAWAVHTLLVEERGLLDMMARLLGRGGDTDSVAAIAWGIASARYPDEVVPAFLEHDLERDRPYGPAFLRTLGERLMRAKKKRRRSLGADRWSRASY